ncbi:TPA: hypothetical protein ACIAFR_004613, partial [Escherichia coli]
ARGKGGWEPTKLQNFDPEFGRKLQAINNALRNGRIEFAHAQVFLRNDGSVNAAVGIGSGIPGNNSMCI